MVPSPTSKHSLFLLLPPLQGGVYLLLNACMSDKLAYQAQLYFKGGGTEEEVIVKEFCSSWGIASKHIKVYFSAKHPNRPVACSSCLEGIAFGNRREMRKLNQKASVSLQSISHAVSAAASMPTSARAGRCCHLSGAQCPGLLGIYMLCTVNYQTQAGAIYCMRLPN